MKLKTRITEILFKYKQWKNKNIIKINDIKQEIFIGIGFVCLCYGLYEIYRPLMWLIAGILILNIGLPKGRK